MKAVATTRMSSKGQVIIPEDVRRKLGLKAGAQFVVVGDNGVVILKSVAQPSIQNFDGLIKKARSQARAAGLTQADIHRETAKVRSSS